MSKQISLTLINKETLTFEINEDARKGDYFSLENINEINLSPLKESLNTEKDNLITAYITDNKAVIFSEMKKEDSEFKKILQDFEQLKADNAHLNGDIRLHEKTITESNEKLKTERQLAISKTKETFNQQITDLQSDLKLKEQAITEAGKTLETERQLAISKTKETFNQQITDLQSDLKLKEQAITEAGKTLETERQLAISKTKETFNQQITDLQSDLKLKEQAITEAGKTLETERQLAISKTKETFNQQITDLQSDLKLKEQAITEAGKTLETERQLAISKTKETFNQQITDLQSDLKLKEQAITEAGKTLETERQLAISKTKETFNQQITDLQSDLKLKEQAITEAEKTLETERQLAISKTKETFNQQITNLQSDLKLKEHAITEAGKTLEIEKQLAVTKETSELKEEIKVLENRRSRMSVKDIGEDLENFMRTEFSNNFYGDYAKFEKTNTSIDGKKPDFKFSILNEDSSEISSIILEAKSESLNSKTKTKNSQHFEKLDLDRQNNHAEYAILVSELEKEEDEFIFKKVNEFEKMFIVRPQYFIALLSLIYNLEVKKRGLQNLEITFKEKQTILAEFDSMKQDIITKTIPLIEKKITVIIDKASKIETLSQAIISEATAALGSNNIATLTRKINNFKIQNILKKMASLK